MGLWGLAEALGTATRLLCLKEQGGFQNCRRNIFRGWQLAAGSEIWVVKHLGAFQMLLAACVPPPNPGAFGGATPQDLGVRDSRICFG